jgi:hypothetical protein
MTLFVVNWVKIVPIYHMSTMITPPAVVVLSEHPTVVDKESMEVLVYLYRLSQLFFGLSSNQNKLF